MTSNITPQANSSEDGPRGEQQIVQRKSMTSYFVLDCMSPLEYEHYLLKVDYSAQKRWEAGVLFSNQDERDGFHQPTEPIELQTKADTEVPPRIYAELYWQPIPLMSRRLVAALQEAGVDNLQTFETRLVTVQGKSPPPVDHYLAVNIVGLVKAADLNKSKTNSDVPEKLTSMDFHSLAIDESKTHEQLMFRLAENISAVLVRERVKSFIESKGINTLTWYRPEDWAG
ncbi:MAG: hypothetical protein A2675_01525 [Candidatus Yonathbacteria bacterium RIFCSPHIGHO2_01_FULL_51_10]|uniref:Immunity MXAN-0049 protein domain-containing protein n=1 Tax=Candidatus Yonathbacteria bacterium RIFCSPHIGHO2_01_FULL_51_10 TaxID=1802723 RepID=A0A1G2S602_9BACT|nr:MAG: hypothetical protein A2675_01525 [Candidatus Yonathbacteria bacterium RIFCSPHIGHO2_01_FULL_51_10]